jgi:hypothetical protein
MNTWILNVDDVVGLNVSSTLYNIVLYFRSRIEVTNAMMRWWAFQGEMLAIDYVGKEQMQIIKN